MTVNVSEAAGVGSRIARPARVSLRAGVRVHRVRCVLSDGRRFLLVQNNERVVEKEEVLRRVWPDAVVEESNLAQNVFTLRNLADTDRIKKVGTPARSGP